MFPMHRNSSNEDVQLTTNKIIGATRRLSICRSEKREITGNVLQMERKALEDTIRQHRTTRVEHGTALGK